MLSSKFYQNLYVKINLLTDKISKLDQNCRCLIDINEALAIAGEPADTSKYLPGLKCKLVEIKKAFYWDGYKKEASQMQSFICKIKKELKN